MSLGRMILEIVFAVAVVFIAMYLSPYDPYYSFAVGYIAGALTATVIAVYETNVVMDDLIAEIAKSFEKERL
jgi:ABC-type uncharacterized transport system permease subunit